jgi:putative transposase
MVLRWTAAGMLKRRTVFRRIKGRKANPNLVAALHDHAHPDRTAVTNTVIPTA